MSRHASAVVDVKTSFDFTHMERWHCPACGKQTVWRIRERHSSDQEPLGCTSCKELFFITTPDPTASLTQALDALSSNPVMESAPKR